MLQLSRFTRRYDLLPSKQIITRSFGTTRHSEKGILVEKYRENTTIEQDPHQLEALDVLQRLHDELIVYKEPTQPSWLHRLGMEEKKEVPRGVYMYGGVGCGKTFLMDLFFEHAPTEAKQRVHFHKWMLHIHERLHQLRKQKVVDGEKKELVRHLADEIVAQTWLWCVDEFQVTDIATALLIRELFSAMLDKGAVVVATSNRHPKELYKNGLQRDLFVPFIHLLMEKCDVHSLDASETDYRRLKAQHNVEDIYLYPLNSQQRDRFKEIFLQRKEGTPVSSIKLTTQGRAVHVPHAVPEQSLAKFTFAELCNKPLGAADYICIAQAFEEVFIESIPRLTMIDLNAARRFITLIDCLYDYGVKVYCLADASAIELFAPEDVETGKQSVHDEVFAFDRTVSRLLEMQSKAYLEAPRVHPASSFLLSFEKDSLSHEDIKRIWTKYDANGDGVLETSELRTLMEDLCHVTYGHRDVPQEAVEAAFRLFLHRPDLDTEIQFEKFASLLEKYGLDLIAL